MGDSGCVNSHELVDQTSVSHVAIELIQRGCLVTLPDHPSVHLCLEEDYPLYSRGCGKRRTYGAHTAKMPRKRQAAKCGGPWR
jgi:hypothetical protein